ncbi:ankyrin repeat-containing domain protein, partial [Lactifluus subvellereus]
AVAFFYCEHDNPKKQDPRSILATLLYQVLRQLPAGPRDDLELDAFAATQSVQKLYSSLKLACIHLERIKPAFLIVDALDECDTTTRKRLLPLLVSLGHASRLLLTSRKQGDIEKALQNTPSIAITAKDVEDDINEYVSRKVRLVDNEDLSDEPLEVGDPALLEEVSSTLIEGADGMFLWAQLQISHLQEQRTDHDIRKALRSLTKGLQPTFTRILKSIDRLPVSRRFRVQRLLRWVVCAVRPLSLRELSEAVVIHDMQETWDNSRCVNRPTALIEDCFNLVLCTEGFSQSSSDAKVQLIHASVKEFLLQNPVLLGSLADYHIYPLPDAQVSIVEDCLKYLRLMAENVQLEESPFVNYASEFWPQHLRASGSAGEQLVSVFCEFMQSTSILANGLDAADAQGSRGLTALHLAAKFAEESTLIVLVESGANINARTTGGQTPLHLAAGNWDGERVVQALLNLEADVTVTDDDGMTPLHVAAQNGYGQKSLLLLLQHGANIGWFSKGGLSPLHAAAANPYGCASVQHLLSYGADINALNSILRTPLHLAAGVWHRSIDSVRMLVERGANVNSTDMDGFTPLHMAAQSDGGGESVKFLIQHGANVDVTSVNGTTPLHLAAKARDGCEVVEYLLENGANVEATDRLLQTPLHLAMTAQQDGEVVQVLLAYQANVHALDNEGLTPLQRIAQTGSGDKIASLLLEHGANPHITDSKKRTPLLLVVEQGRGDDPRLV